MFRFLQTARMRFSAWLDSMAEETDLTANPGLWIGLGEPSPFVPLPCVHLEERRTLRVRVSSLERELLTLKLEVRDLLLQVIASFQMDASPEQDAKDLETLCALLQRIQPLLR